MIEVEIEEIFKQALSVEHSFKFGEQPTITTQENIQALLQPLL